MSQLFNATIPKATTELVPNLVTCEKLKEMGFDLPLLEGDKSILGYAYCMGSEEFSTGMFYRESEEDDHNTFQTVMPFDNYGDGFDTIVACASHYYNRHFVFAPTFGQLWSAAIKMLNVNILTNLAAIFLLDANPAQKLAESLIAQCYQLNPNEQSSKVLF